MIILLYEWKTNSSRQNQYICGHPYVHTRWVKRCTCLLVKNRLYEQHRNDFFILHIFAMEAWKKDVCCGINFCDVDILWKKCWIYFCDPNVLTKCFQSSLKKRYDIYENNLYMFFLLIYLLCKNIDTMPSLMWSVLSFSVYWNDDYTSIVFFM